MPTPLKLDTKTVIFLSFTGRDDTNIEDVSPTTQGKLERREQSQ